MSTSPVAVGPAEVPRTLPIEGRLSVNLLWQRTKIPLLATLGGILFLGFWEWQQTSVQFIPSLFIPPPSAIFEALVKNTANGVIPQNLLWSYKNYVLGFGLAILVGVPLGLLMGTSQWLNKIIGPYVWTLYSTPRIAFLPIIIVAMGFGPEPKVLLIFLSCVFPLLINTMAGVQTVDASLITAGRVFGLSRVQMYTKIILPYTWPFVLTGLRIGATRGFLGMYGAEITGSPAGIGSLIVKSTLLYEIPLSFACIVVLVLSSMLLLQVFTILERVLMPWKQEVQV